MTNPDREELVKLADNERALFDVADRAYFKACDTSDPQDWLQAGLLAQQHRNALAALRRLASSDSVVKVKPLEWREPAGCFSATSHNLTGNYNIEDSGPNWSHDRYHLRLTFFGELGRLSTLEAAKAAAQADYEARIKSALVEVPAVKGEPEPVAHRKMTREEYNALNLKGWHFVRHDGDCEGVTEVSYTAPPADAGMREAYSALCLPRESQASDNLEGALYDIERLSAQGKPTDHVCIRTLKRVLKQLVTAERALTAPGATTKSDGGEVITAEQMDAIEKAAVAGRPLTEPFAGKVPCHCHDDVSQRLCLDKDRCYTVEAQPVQAIKMPEYRYQEPDPRGGNVSFGNYGEYTPVTVRGSTSDPSSTRSEVTASLEGDAVERVELPLARAINDVLNAMVDAQEEMTTTKISARILGNGTVRAILATGLVPDEAAIRADEREKIKDLSCESLLVMSDGYLNNPADDKVRVALSNAAVLIFGKERALRIRAAIRSGGAQ